jgi:hypothetical protein
LGVKEFEMEILIYTLEGKPLVVNLDDVGACYPDDDVIYFRGIPCRLSSAAPNTARTGQEPAVAVESQIACGSCKKTQIVVGQHLGRVMVKGKFVTVWGLQKAEIKVHCFGPCKKK